MQQRQIYGDSNYIKSQKKNDFDLEDYNFIKFLKDNDNLDLDTLFELTYAFAKKHEEKFKSISANPSFNQLVKSNNFFNDSNAELDTKLIGDDFSKFEASIADENSELFANYFFHDFIFDLPYQRPAGSSDDSDINEDSDDFDEGDFLSLELQSIIKPVRILMYSLDRPKGNRYNYRNWRPTNFTTPDSKIYRKYFYAYDPSTTFSYEIDYFKYILSKRKKHSVFRPNSHDSLVRTVRYSQARPMRFRYKPESQPDPKFSKLRKKKIHRRENHQYTKKSTVPEDPVDDAEFYDSLIAQFELFGEFKLNGWLIRSINLYIKKFSGDLLFPDWFNALVIFNLIFYISDYIIVFFYWYFPYFLNLFSINFNLTKILYLYVICFSMILLVLFFVYIYALMITNNTFYTFISLLLFSFCSFSIIVGSIFPLSFFMNFSLLIFFVSVSTFFMINFLSFDNKIRISYVSYTNPNAIFGFYKPNYYFCIYPFYFIMWPSLCKKNIFIGKASSPRVSYFKPLKNHTFLYYNNLTKNFERSMPMLPPPLYYPNLFADTAFNSNFEANTPTPPNQPALMLDEMDYDQDGPFSPELTTIKQFTFHHTIKYRNAPQAPTKGFDEDDMINYQAEYSLFAELGEKDDDSYHLQGSWYPASTVFSPQAIAIYHPYSVIHISRLPFFKYYALRVFVNSLQIYSLQTLPIYKQPFFKFLSITFYNNFFTLQQLEGKEFSDFKTFKNFKILYAILLFVNFLLILFELIFELIMVTATYFCKSERENHFKFNLFSILFFPSCMNYRKIFKFYINLQKSNFNPFGFKIFFILIVICSFAFFFNVRYYSRLYKLSKSYINLFFQFLLHFLFLTDAILPEKYTFEFS